MTLELMGLLLLDYLDSFAMGMAQILAVLFVLRVGVSRNFSKEVR